MKTKLRIPAGVLALAIALGASAAALPQQKTQNGIAYIDGGVGRDEAAAMKAEARAFPLSLVFSAGKHNEYLADIKVTMKDRAGKEILSTTAAGPIMLVRAPAGTYTIAAERDGKTLHRKVHLHAKGDQRVDFHWPSA